MVNRQQLSYLPECLKPDDVFVQHVDTDVDFSVFGGTIFDGIYVKDTNNTNNSNNTNNTNNSNNSNNTHDFIITDVYHFKGINYSDIKLDFKLVEMSSYLNSLEFDDILHVKTNLLEKKSSRIKLNLSVNKLYDLFTIKNFVDVELKIIEKKNKHKGICFYPEISGTKLIYMINTFENNDNSTNPNSMIYNKNNSISNMPNTINLPNSINSSNSMNLSNTINLSNVSNEVINTNENHKKTFIPKNNDPIYAVLEIKQTSIPDNYKLYAIDTVVINDLTRYKKIQLDIAYIPSIDKSNWCKNILSMSRTTKKPVHVKCIWRDEKQKWEPIDVVEVKIPSFMSDIKTNIIEIESDIISDDE
jgi:hypothetical protein